MDYQLSNVIIHLSKPPKCTPPRVSPNVNYRLLSVIVGSSVVTKRPSGGDVYNGGGCAPVRAGGIWEISEPSSQVCYKSKTVLKNKAFKNKKIIKMINNWT